MTHCQVFESETNNQPCELMLGKILETLNIHFTFIDAIGIAGVFMVLWAYLCIQIDKLSREDLSFSMINFIGSILILISLIHTMNLASFVIEIAWLLISAYGIHRCLKIRRASKNKGDTHG